MSRRVLLRRSVRIALIVACGTLLMSAPVLGAESTEEGGWTFKPIRLIEPLGICTLSLLIATVLIGLFRRKLGRRFLLIHKLFAMATVVSGICHATLVFVLF